MSAVAASPDGLAQDYSPGAEFYDLVARRHTESLAGVLGEALAALPDAGDAWVVEPGAGTGRVTRLLAAALPGARILAGEPSPIMRAILTARMHEDEALRPRVTVRPEPAQHLPLPDRIVAMVLIGVVGHLDLDDRRALWRRVRERLVPGGAIVVDLMGTQRPGMPETLLLRERIGLLTYSWWARAEPHPSGASRFLTRWTVTRDEAPVREVAGEHLWHSLDAAALASESGLPCRTLTGGTDDAAPSVVVLGP